MDDNRLVETLLDHVDTSVLYEPYRLAGTELRNRFVMAPMTRSASPDGVPTAEVAAYYRRRAEHFGLIVTEGTYVDHPAAGGDAAVPRMFGATSAAGWRTVVDAVHEVGGRIFPQLWHLGQAREEGAPPYPHGPVLSPSGLRHDGSRHGVAATLQDIDDVVRAFADAAALAQQIGFDGVEIHGAHGYLLDTFLWTKTNRRTDAYGGSLAAGARFSAEVVAAIRDRVGPDYPVTFRYSQWKGGAFDAQLARDPSELETLLAPLVDAGLSGFHVSTRRYWLPAFDASDRTLAGWTKHLTGLPTIAIGSVGVREAYGERANAAPTLSLAPVVELVERGEFDLIALGRAALSDAAWPQKVRDGRLDEIRHYDKAHEAHLS